jgi:hypothetical protein
MPWQRHESAILLGMIVLIAGLVYGLTRPAPGCAASSERQAIRSRAQPSLSAISTISAPELSTMPATAAPGEISRIPAPAPSALRPSEQRWHRSTTAEVPSALRSGGRSPLSAASHETGNC